MVQRQLGIHLLLFPFVISRLGDLVLATNIGHRPSCFYCFQDRDDLTLTELASLHKVSFGPAMLPRKPLLFNGPLFGEGYKPIKKNRQGMRIYRSNDQTSSPR